MILEAIENLRLSFCKCQKWKEQVEVSKCGKFGDLIVKTVSSVRFLKTIKYPEILKENVWEFAKSRYIFC